MKKETKVNCEVETCIHNEDNQCCLDELDIGCTCDNDACEEIEETICNNFEKEETDDETREELEYDEEDNEDDEEDEIDYDDDETEITSDDEQDDEEYSEEIIEEYIEIEEEKDL